MIHEIRIFYFVCLFYWESPATTEVAVGDKNNPFAALKKTGHGGREGGKMPGSRAAGPAPPRVAPPDGARRASPYAAGNPCDLRQ